MANDSDARIGRRLREIRTWRGLSVQAVAELAGFTKGYVSMIERGLRPVDRRSTLEALATALKVAPHELVGSPLLVGGVSDEQAAVVSLRAALGEYDPDDGDTDPPPWEQLQGGIDQVNDLRPRCEYIQLSLLLPELLRGLYASLHGQHRRAALMGLADCYLSALSACKSLGYPDLAQAAALRTRDISHMLSAPEWTGMAAYARAQAIGSGARERSRALAVRAADEISSDLDRPEVAEVYGMLHLMAAMASTTQGKLDRAQDHVNEAADIAARPEVGSHNRMHYLWFGPGNVGIWQTALAVERGEGGRAVDIARNIDPVAIPAAASRQASWWIDVGRAHAMEGKARREDAVRAFRRAEDIAPQLTRANPWVRETVTGLLSHARRDAGGRELRGLAHRIGLDGSIPMPVH